jgi:hypothetical protein
MSELGTYHGAPTIMRKTLDLNRSRISMLEVEAVPQSCIPQVQMGDVEFTRKHELSGDLGNNLRNSIEEKISYVCLYEVCQVNSFCI